MRLQIAARHMQLSEALRDHVQHRFLDTLPHHYDRDSCDLRVEIDHPTGEGKRRYEEVHAQLTVPGGMLVAHGRAKDAYTAVDVAQKQLLRRLDEWTRRLKLGGRKPKKYYAARLVEQGALPSTIAPNDGDPRVFERDGGARVTDAAQGLRRGGLREALSFDEGPGRPRPIGRSPSDRSRAGRSLADGSSDETDGTTSASFAEALESAARADVPPHRRPEELLGLLATRRSVRRFLPASIPDDVTRMLEEVLQNAPSADNLESRRFYFVKTERLRKALAQTTRGQPFVNEGSLLPPLLIVCCAHLGSASINHRRGVELFAPMDVAAAIEDLLLAAHGAGLGAVWIGDFDEAEVADVLTLPWEIRPMALVAVGWPAERPAPPPHLPLRELVHEV